ncbi:MAG TPA: hypothetical protein VGD91_30530 [Trebonia sp.]
MPLILPFASEPSPGRVFEGRRRVRATDATAAGRLRRDGLARFLQDVAEHDVADTGWQPPYGWLLRRCAVTAREYPPVTARVTLRTFCWTAFPLPHSLSDGPVSARRAAAAWPLIPCNRSRFHGIHILPHWLVLGREGHP